MENGQSKKPETDDDEKTERGGRGSRGKKGMTEVEGCTGYWGGE